jgi:hypothetical protein
MTSSELSLRLARPVDATTIANLSRDLIEYGLRWRWIPMRVAASIRAPEVNVLVARIHKNIAGVWDHALRRRGRTPGPSRCGSAV